MLSQPASPPASTPAAAGGASPAARRAAGAGLGGAGVPARGGVEQGGRAGAPGPRLPAGRAGGGGGRRAQPGPALQRVGGPCSCSRAVHPCSRPRRRPRARPGSCLSPTPPLPLPPRTLTLPTAHGPHQPSSHAAARSSLASPSTWSLERLDALAAEASAHFRHAIAPGLLAATGRRDALLAGAAGPAGGAPPGSGSGGSDSGSGSSGSAAAPHLDFASDELPPTSDEGVWAAVSAGLPSNHVPHAASPAGPAAAEGGLPGAQGGGGGRAERGELEQLAAGLPEQQVQALMRRYPVQALDAVNTVIFYRHGYRAGNRWAALRVQPHQGPPCCALCSRIRGRPAAPWQPAGCPDAASSWAIAHRRVRSHCPAGGSHTASDPPSPRHRAPHAGTASPTLRSSAPSWSTASATPWPCPSSTARSARAWACL